jgi:biotin transporter BioY
MTGVLLYGYLGGWIVTSIVVGLVVWRLRDGRAPAPHPALMSIVAGAAWPVFVVAIAEVGAVALTAEVLHEDEHRITVDA